MKILTALILIAVLAAPSAAYAYRRDVKPYQPETAEEGPAPTDEEEIEKKHQEEIEKLEKEYGGGPGATAIAGYVLLTIGGMAAIAGSTMVVAMDDDLLGACISGGGAAMALAGTLMITLGSHGGYAAGPSIDPKTGTYGVVLAKRF